MVSELQPVKVGVFSDPPQSDHCWTRAFRIAIATPVILKPFKLQECILHFWKPLIFINLVSAGQDHSYVLNTRFWLQKRSTFHRACVIGVYILFSLTVAIYSFYFPLLGLRQIHSSYYQ